MGDKKQAKNRSAPKGARVTKATPETPKEENHNGRLRPATKPDVEAVGTAVLTAVAEARGFLGGQLSLIEQEISRGAPMTPPPATPAPGPALNRVWGSFHLGAALGATELVIAAEGPVDGTTALAAVDAAGIAI